MRATFITRTLDNGANLEEVQRTAGHTDAATTKSCTIDAATTRRRQRAALLAIERPCHAIARGAAIGLRGARECRALGGELGRS